VTQPRKDPNVEPFSADAASNDGYIYTTNASMSSRVANQRLTDVTLELADFDAKRVIDIGCGDGTYGREILGAASPALVLGIDPAQQAVEIARRKAADPRLVFSVSSAYSLPCPDDSFDIAYLRGVLHHMDQPVDALREALRVAPVVVVTEPNGYNLGLKVIERTSKYHIEHGEKSYAPRTLDRWVGELGGRVTLRRWVGLVPMFSPDWIARPLKWVEPGLERLPILRAVGCGTYAFAVVHERALTRR
jgi:SAM-dependent methyltransferase